MIAMKRRRSGMVPSHMQPDDPSRVPTTGTSEARMASIEGRVILTQESRFQLLDWNGVGHHFVLGHAAAAEPEQLPALQRIQARVRVRYRGVEGILAHVALTITVLPG